MLNTWWGVGGNLLLSVKCQSSWISPGPIKTWRKYQRSPSQYCQTKERKIEVFVYLIYKHITTKQCRCSYICQTSFSHGGTFKEQDHASATVGLEGVRCHNNCIQLVLHPSSLAGCVIMVFSILLKKEHSQTQSPFCVFKNML